MIPTLAIIIIALLLAGCGKHYWEGSGRGFGEFQTDSGQCIQEAKTKYEVSERIYRQCMRAQGWDLLTKSSLALSEDEDEFFSPPNPLSERGVAPGTPGRADDPACVGATAARPPHCPRR